jgi:zinc protease
MRVAATYFVEDNMTVGHYLPVAPDSESEASAQAVGDESDGGTADSGRTGAGDATATLPATATNFAQRVTRTTLSNGLTLMVMPNKGSGVVAVSGKIKAGAFFCPERQNLSKLTAWLLTSGSKRFSKNELSDRLLSLGTSLTFNAGSFSSDFSSAMGKSGFESYVELLADVLVNPSFAPEELLKLSRQVQGSLQAAAGEPAMLGTIKLAQLLYQPGHVFYKKSLPDQLAELKSVTHDEAAAFHRRFYTPANTIITVVGDVEPAYVAALFEKHLSGWQGGKADAITVPSVELPGQAQRVEVKFADKTSVDIFIGVPSTLKRTDGDFQAARLANAALGLDTISSRLGAVVREKHGLTYGINSMFQDPIFGMAPWMIHLSVNPANSEKALALVAQVMEEYREQGITQKELADEAGRAYGLTVVGLSSSRGIADMLTTLEFSGAGVEALDNLAASLSKVTVAEANEAIRKHFCMDLAATVLAGVAK